MVGWSIGLLAGLTLLTCLSGVAERFQDLDSEIVAQYSKYLEEHKKNTNRLADSRRIAQFIKHSSLIAAHNLLVDKSLDLLHKPNFKLSLNHLADLLPEELNGMFTSEEVNTATEMNSNPELQQSVFTDIQNSEKSLIFRFPWDRSRHSQASIAADLPDSLDWSGGDNPMGTSVMSAVRNQGNCGACWAFVAVAISEAALRISLSSSSSAVIASRESATLRGGSIVSAGAEGSEQETLEEDVTQHLGGFSPTALDYTTATTSSSNDNNYTASAPRLAWIPSLSVQQLVDCDTSFNRGCGGGSPLFAFHYIVDHGLVPWSMYGYEEKVDVCALNTAASALHSAKYYIKSYGKLALQDPAALISELQRGPVALGVCGTDPFFLLYSSGVFDLDDCCTAQNHALTLVGYGHDSATGLDYWLAQNSWGERWGESGFIKLKRTAALGETGICGMLLNPMFGTGGYIRDAQGRYVDPAAAPHFPLFVSDLAHWLQDHWREAMLTTSALLMGLSLLILLYACYLDRLLYLHSELRAAREGYRAIPTPATADRTYPGAGYSYNSSSTGSRNIGEASTDPNTTSTTATSAA